MHEIFWSENRTGRDHLEEKGVDGRIIFEWILNRTVKCRLDSSSSEYEHGGKAAGSTEGGEFLD
jgi:hypothetical protein